MQTRTLLATLVAAAFAFPLAANAGGADKHKQMSGNGANDGGAAAMFNSMDKNGDGFISKDEALGTPHHADFAKLDKNGDGKLSPDEHAAAAEHAGAKSGAASSASSASPSPAKSSPSSTGSTSSTTEKKTY